MSGAHRVPCRVSVVIPVYNERESLDILTGEITEVLQDEDYEIVFVDDGSTDGSREVMQRLAAANDRIRLVRFRRNFGKSAALAAGFRESRGDIVITMDADLQDDPHEIPNFLKRIDEGLDLVSGWKAKRLDPIDKTLPSRIFNAVTAYATGIHNIRDFNCGFKAYRRELVDRLSIYGELHRFIPALAAWKGFEIDEIAVNHRPRKYGRSKFGARRFLSGILDLITVLFLTRFNRKPLHLFGSVGLALFAGGLAILAYLSVLRIAGEAIGTRPLLTLGVLLVLVGLQFFSVGLLADLTNLSRTNAEDFDHRYDVWQARDTAAIERPTRRYRPRATRPRPVGTR